MLCIEAQFHSMENNVKYLPHLHDGARTLSALSDSHDLSLPACLFVHQTADGMNTLAPERKELVLIECNWNGILIGGARGWTRHQDL